MSALLSDPSQQLRQQLLDHPLYAEVDSLPKLRLLMREHVFAVWDFMSLLKRMQQIVTCVDIPWTPRTDPVAARFILEIVLGEEADEDGRGSYASHFDLYRQAMQELGADTRPIDRFLARIEQDGDWQTALETADILPTTKAFTRASLETALHGAPQQVAAAFFYGREDIIPEMFSRLIHRLQAEGTGVDRFRHYLRRHIELDGDHHGPLAQQLLEKLCQQDAARLAAAQQTAIEALTCRIRLWDGVYEAVQTAAIP